MDVFVGDAYGDKPQTYTIHPPKSSTPSSSSSRVAVCGGGPCGLFAAIALRESGHSKVTVLERRPSPTSTSYDAHRSYVFALNPRGQAAVSAISPSLLAHLRSRTPVPDGYQTCVIDGTGGVTLKDPCEMFPGFKPGMLFYRPVFVSALSEYASKLGGIDIYYDFQVDRISVRPGSKGCTILSTKGDAVDADVVLACDGVGSSTLSAANKHTGGVFEPRKTWTSAAVGNRSRSLLVQKRALLQCVPGIPEHFETSHWTTIKGNDFNLSLLPLPVDAIERHGGALLATVVLPPGHEVWGMKDVDGMYELFSRNFGYMNEDELKNVVTREHMEEFVQGRYSTFPSISHPPSITSSINGAVVIALGDAAHTVPPDMGQGLNASIEDVTILSSILSSHVDWDWCKVATQYQDERFEDVKALCELCAFAGQAIDPGKPVRNWVASVDTKMRTMGDKKLPKGWVYPPVFAMLSRQWPYAVARRRYRVTTIRLLAAVGVCVAIALYVLAAAIV